MKKACGSLPPAASLDIIECKGSKETSDLMKILRMDAIRSLLAVVYLRMDTIRLQTVVI